MTLSEAALVAAANDFLAPLASDTWQTLLVSLRAGKLRGWSFGLIIARSTVDSGPAWAILAAAQGEDWEICEISPLAFDEEDPRAPCSRESPYELSELWLEYGKGSAKGVVVAFNRNPEGVAAIRCRHAPANSLWVGPDLLIALSWNIKKFREPKTWGRYWLRPQEIELRLAHSSAWEPAADLRTEIVSLRLFVETCRRYPRTERPEDYWAWDDLGQWDQRDRFALVRTVIEASALEERELLGRLGAGPLEDMEPGFLLDHIGPAGLADRRWLFALAFDRDFSEPGPWAERLDRLLTPEMRPWLTTAQAWCG